MSLEITTSCYLPWLLIFPGYYKSHLFLPLYFSGVGLYKIVLLSISLEVWFTVAVSTIFFSCLCPISDLFLFHFFLRLLPLLVQTTLFIHLCILTFPIPVWYFLTSHTGYSDLSQLLSLVGTATRWRWGDTHPHSFSSQW